jgi:hypothetical protein
MKRVIFAIPLFGWMLRDAAKGSASAQAFFLVNIALLWLLAAIFFGFPGIIIPALIAVPTAFVLLILLTMGA